MKSGLIGLLHVSLSLLIFLFLAANHILFRFLIFLLVLNVVNLPHLTSVSRVQGSGFKVRDRDMVILSVRVRVRLKVRG